jgi:glycylpeptide N-tetradecanoyltransferase
MLQQEPSTGRITDFFSFYSLPSTIINNPKHDILEAAYLFYYATDVAFQKGIDDENDGRLKNRLLDLMGDALIVADQAKFDVFNALTLMDNVVILEDLKVRTCFLGIKWLLYSFSSRSSAPETVF